jgi:NitT/TauT family transport system permease protein
MYRNLLGRHVTVVGIVLLLLVLWQISMWLFEFRPFIIPSPESVFNTLWNNPYFYLRNTWATLEVTLIGFAIAVVLGVATAILIIQSQTVEDSLLTCLVALNSLPKVALAPLFVIWFGTGAESKVLVVVTIAIFPIVIDTVLGLKSIEPDALNMAKAMRTSRLKTLWYIRLPNALPSLFAGMKVSISLALIGAIVAEFVAGNVGLGNAILTAQGVFNTAQVFACILLLALLGIALFFLVGMAERQFVPWHPSNRSQEHRAPADRRSQVKHAQAAASST